MEETNSNNNDLLLEIADELNLIIDYIQSNSEKLDKRETDSGEENSRGDNFLLGIKRKNPIELFENENDINSKEFQDKNEKEIIMLKNKKLKLKIIEFQRHSNEIIRKIKDILLKIKINNNKINNDDSYEDKYINIDDSFLEKKIF